MKFVGPRGQKIMRSANNVGNAGPHVRQTFLNDVLTFLAEVGNAGRIVNTGTSSVNSEFVTTLNTQCFHLMPGTGYCYKKSPAMNFPSMG